MKLFFGFDSFYVIIVKYVKYKMGVKYFVLNIICNVCK